MIVHVLVSACCAEVKPTKKLNFLFLIDNIPTVPENCTKITHFEYVKLPGAYNCTSVDLMAVGVCNGGCGKLASLCCKATVINQINVKFRCLDGSTTISKVNETNFLACG